MGSVTHKYIGAYFGSSRLAFADGGVAHFFLTGLGAGVGVQIGLLLVGHPELTLPGLLATQYII